MNTQNFIKLPKILFTSTAYSSLSAQAKLLYAMVCDRLSLSERNDWTDENGDVFLFYSLDEICSLLGCGHSKGTRVLAELEAVRLISRKRQGQGKPHRIYVYPPMENEEKVTKRCSKTAVKTAQKQQSRVLKNSSQDCSKTAPNKTDHNKTERSDTDNYNKVREAVENRIAFEDLKTDERYRDLADTVVSVLAETEVGLSETVQVGKDTFPRTMVQARLRTVDAECVQEVLEDVLHSPSKILRIKPYLLSALFHAPTAFKAQVTADYSFDIGGL